MGILPPTVRNKRRTELRRSMIVVAFITACVATPDAPVQSWESLPSTPNTWTLSNLPSAHVFRASLARGESTWYTRQIVLRVPIVNRLRVSAKFWVRWGADENHLAVPSRAEYERLGFRCELTLAGGAPTDFAQRCIPHHTPWVEACEWPVTLASMGELGLELHCTVPGDGTSHAFTVGATEMTVCSDTASTVCYSVEIEPALAYQGGANIARPGDIVIFFVDAPTH